MYFRSQIDEYKLVSKRPNFFYRTFCTTFCQHFSSIFVYCFCNWVLQTLSSTSIVFGVGLTASCHIQWIIAHAMGLQLAPNWATRISYNCVRKLRLPQGLFRQITISRLIGAASSLFGTRKQVESWHLPPNFRFRPARLQFRNASGTPTSH